jgi:hypothetical protein
MRNVDGGCALRRKKERSSNERILFNHFDLVILGPINLLSGTYES